MSQNSEELRVKQQKQYDDLVTQLAARSLPAEVNQVLYDFFVDSECSSQSQSNSNSKNVSLSKTKIEFKSTITNCDRGEILIGVLVPGPSRLDSEDELPDD